MKRTLFLPFITLTLILLGSCKNDSTDFQEIGQGFESYAFHAPWSGLDNDTRFTCHATKDRFFFSYEVTDSTLILTEPFTNEMNVNDEDRVEFFFSPTKDLKKPYYCAEIDAKGRVMDYKATFYRQFDFSWNFSTIETHSKITPWGYRVGGSVTLDELRQLGIRLEKGFWMGAFQDEANADGNINWFSLISTDDKEADFHQPKVFFPCRITDNQQKRGVVVYPDDITSLGLEEWGKRINQANLNLIGIHAATFNDPIDTLQAFIQSTMGQDFLAYCNAHNVDVEYELHSVETLLPRSLFDEHPEYFRQDEDGKRVSDYNFCFTSTEAVEAMRPQLENLLKWMKPTTHRYYLWPDDVQKKYCYCPQCCDYTPSEQILIFENRLLKMLREYDPQAKLAHLAYHQTLPAPRKVRAAEGVFLEYAPILRDYEKPLPEEEQQALQDNLLAFPPYSQHILEYWLDESMNARWKKDQLPFLRFEPAQCSRDIELYNRLGAKDFTTFATWLNANYVSLYGDTEAIFGGYGKALDNYK